MNLAAHGRITLALRNLLRHRARTSATLAAISIGVASLILTGGFVKDIFFQLGEATIHSQTGHIQFAREGFWNTRSRAPLTHMINDANSIADKLRSIQGVDQVVARVNFAGVLNNGKRDLGIIGDGVEANGEAKVGSFMHYIEGRPLSDKDADGIVIGQGVAGTLNLSIGDPVNLVANLAQGAVNTLEFKVIGIFQSFSKEFDARAVRIPLSAAHELLDTRGNHTLVMTLTKTSETDRVIEVARSKVKSYGIEARSWKELSDFFEKTVQLYEAQFGVLRIIIFLMVLLSVANSINMTIFERTREFGTLMALGDNPRQVTLLILTESALLGLLGAVLGMILGCIGAWGISAVGISMPPPPNSNLGYTAQIRLDIVSVLVSCLIGFAATVIAAIFPARRAGRIDVVEALRHGV